MVPTLERARRAADLVESISTSKVVEELTLSGLEQEVAAGELRRRVLGATCFRPEFALMLAREALPEPEERRRQIY